MSAPEAAGWAPDRFMRRFDESFRVAHERAGRGEMARWFGEYAPRAKYPNRGCSIRTIMVSRRSGSHDSTPWLVQRAELAEYMDCWHYRNRSWAVIRIL